MISKKDKEPTVWAAMNKRGYAEYIWALWDDKKRVYTRPALLSEKRYGLADSDGNTSGTFSELARVATESEAYARQRAHDLFGYSMMAKAKKALGKDYLYIGGSPKLPWRQHRDEILRYLKDQSKWVSKRDMADYLSLRLTRPIKANALDWVIGRMVNDTLVHKVDDSSYLITPFGRNVIDGIDERAGKVNDHGAEEDQAE